MFDSSNKERENEKEMFNNIAVGKLNTKNLFENNEKEDIEKPVIKVGKIKTKDLFSETCEMANQKTNINVGKLKIKVIFSVCYLTPCKYCLISNLVVCQFEL